MTQHVETPQSHCRWGGARGDITPPDGIYQRMWGAATHERADGIHRPLTATVMVLDRLQGEPSPHVWITLDHCLLGQRELQPMLNLIEQQQAISAESVTVTFSHTHAAGLLGQDRWELAGGELIPPYLEKLTAKVSELVAAAVESMQPVTICYGQGQCDLAAHRDYWDESSQQFVCGYNPQGEVDQTVLVGRVDDVEGRTLATVINYACHPTTLAWDNQQISPDYPGAMREVVEEATGVPCMFIQGAAGDVGPKEGFVGDVAVADRNGRQLGYAALSALTALPAAGKRFEYAGPVISGATLGTWHHVPLSAESQQQCQHWQLRRLTLPLAYRAELSTPEEVERERSDWQQQEQSALEAGDAQRVRDCHAQVERRTRVLGRLENLPAGEAYPYQIVISRMGGAIWIAVQGEPYNELQRTLRKRFPQMAIVIATVAGAWGASYLPPADCYGKGIYQESIAVLKPGSLEQVIEEISGEIERCLEETC